MERVSWKGNWKNSADFPHRQWRGVFLKRIRGVPSAIGHLSPSHCPLYLCSKWQSRTPSQDLIQQGTSHNVREEVSRKIVGRVCAYHCLFKRLHPNKDVEREDPLWGLLRVTTGHITPSRTRMSGIYTHTVRVPTKDLQPLSRRSTCGILNELKSISMLLPKNRQNWHL